MRQYFQSIIEQEWNHLFLWFPVGLGLGIVTYFSLVNEPSLWVSLLLLATSLILLAVCWRHPYLRLLAAACFSFILGFTAINYKTWQLSVIERVAPLQQNEKGIFAGQIQDIEFMQNRQRFIIHLDDGRYVRLSAKDGDNLGIGDEIKFQATLLPFASPVLGDGYNYGRIAFFKKLSATGRMVQVTVLNKQSANQTNIQKLRSRLTQALFSAIPGESGAIAAALVTGERGRVSEVTRQAYADAGIAHVLAISGLHLSLIAGLIFMLVRRGLCLSMTLAENYNLKKMASILTIPFLLSYLLISGMGVPAIRSFIMVSIVLLGVIVERQAISMRTLAFAAIVILLFQPESLVSASFALSFSAVMALIAVYEDGWTPLKDWANRGGICRRFIVYFVGIVASTLIAALATLPITLYIFNRISLQAIIGNLIAIPLMGFAIMPLLLVGVLSLIFGSFSWVFFLLEKTIGYLTKVAVWTASLPGAAIQVAKPMEPFIWLMTLGGLWLCLWRTKIRYAGIVPCAAAMALLFIKPDPFVWLTPDSQFYWYNGHHLSTFANARHNDFVEEILLRQVGLQEMNVVADDVEISSIQGSKVVMLNEKFSWVDYKKHYKDADVLVSARYLPDSLIDQHDLIIDRLDLRDQRGGVIYFQQGGAVVRELYFNRPWDG